MPRPSPNERIALGAGILAVLLWSTVATGFKLGLAVLAPVQLLWLGTLISLAFFTVALLVSGRWRGARWQWQYFALGAANPAAYYVVLFEAYDRLPAQVAQPLNLTWPLLSPHLYPGVDLVRLRGARDSLDAPFTGALASRARRSFCTRSSS